MSLYKELVNMQSFNFTDQYKIDKKRELFKDDLKLITKEIKVYLFRVNYSYKTIRNNKRTNYKIVVLNENDIAEAKIKFLQYIEEFNNEFPIRKISNVKILDVQSEEMLIPLL